MIDQVFLLVSAFMFCAGLFITVTKHNAIFVLIGIELMLNASNINFVIFNQQDGHGQGSMSALFVMVIAAAETAIALAIIFKIYEHYQSSDIRDANELKN